MKSIKNLRKFLRRQTMTEYAIIVALIALACVVAIRTLGGNIKDTLGNVNIELENANDDYESNN